MAVLKLTSKHLEYEEFKSVKYYKYPNVLNVCCLSGDFIVYPEDIHYDYLINLLGDRYSIKQYDILYVCKAFAIKICDLKTVRRAVKDGKNIIAIKTSANTVLLHTTARWYNFYDRILGKQKMLINNIESWPKYFK